MKKMSERIRRARRNADFSQAELAEHLKVQRSAVSNWESASGVQPSLQNLIAIARVCSVSFEWLGAGRGVMCPDGIELADIPALHAELVEAQEERELLLLFRNLSRKKQQQVMEVLEVFLGSRGR